MTALEIILLVVGGVIFIASFVIPVKKKETSEEIREMIGDEVKLKVKTEIDELRGHIDDVVDEAIEYAQEKTERSLERISNEKIMAVNEYSDTVLEEINKNHKEVMFLYDMLNDKHEDLKSTVSEATVVAKKAKENAAQVANAAQVQTAPAKVPAATQPVAAADDATGKQGVSSIPPVPVAPVPHQTADNTPAPAAAEAEKTEAKKTEEKPFRTLKWAEFALEQADEVYEGNKPNVQDQVIALHKLGKSDIDIARDLNMGVGEVSLIIGLHAK